MRKNPVKLAANSLPIKIAANSTPLSHVAYNKLSPTLYTNNYKLPTSSTISNQNNFKWKKSSTRKKHFDHSKIRSHYLLNMIPSWEIQFVFRLFSAW